MKEASPYHVEKVTFCQGCWEQMHMPIAIRGPLSYFFKPFGIKKSRMHPNLCTICESMFTTVKKGKQIDVNTTILFADLRGYTHMSQHLDSSMMNEVLHAFYDACSGAVWERDGIVNKFIGDAVLAIFNFPLVRDLHAHNAVHAAIRLQEQFQIIRESISLPEGHEMGIGIGIHTGHCNIGEVGNAYKDFTAVGAVVNLASRIQNAAESGEIIITEDVYQIVMDEFPNLPSRTFQLKGIDHEVKGYVIANVKSVISNQ